MNVIPKRINLNLVGQDLTGWKIQRVFEVQRSNGSDHLQTEGYFTDKILAEVVAQENKPMQGQGEINEVFVLTQDGKTGYLISDNIDLGDESKIFHQKRKEALSLLTPEQRSLLGV